MNNLSNLVVYNDGELELKVSVNEETIWLTQNNMLNFLKLVNKILVYILIIFLMKKNSIKNQLLSFS